MTTSRKESGRPDRSSGAIVRGSLSECPCNVRLASLSHVLTGQQRLREEQPLQGKE